MIWGWLCLFILPLLPVGSQLPTDLQMGSPFELRKLEGRVVDTAGKPVTTVDVFFVPVDTGGDAYQITHESTDENGHFATTAIPHTYLITTDQRVAHGGIDLDRPNIFLSYFKLEPGHDFTSLVIPFVPKTDRIGELNGCGFALRWSGLSSCLQTVEQQMAKKVQKEFESVLQAVPPTLQGNVKKAQSTWLQYREEQCQAAFARTSTPLESAVEKTSCQIRLEQARLQELRDLLIPPKEEKR